jgi:hypothetical protein
MTQKEIAVAEKKFIELINTYPSPHNGQPMVMRKSGQGTYDVFFETSRGLSATPISYLFSFVTVGAFMRYVELCAQALGHTADVQASLPDDASSMATPGRLYCGTVRIDFAAGGPVSALEEAIRFRQTSRKKYSSGLTDGEKETAKHLAQRQRAVFDDMFNPAARAELMHWLRFTHEEKVAKRDGLSYDCMELSGSALRFVCRNYRALRWPIVAPLLKRYYLRTMKDDSTVLYVSGAFVRPADAYAIGQFISNFWLDLSKNGAYLHPFGTIVANDEAHAEFVRLVEHGGEDRASNYVVFICRAGRSEPPVRSERLDLTHILEEKND